jgi:hypothetical protein
MKLILAIDEQAYQGAVDVSKAQETEIECRDIDSSVSPFADSYS